jgi:type IV pilus assembly protein PilO
MPDLRQTRKKLKTALVVMGAIDLLAAVIYISPLVGSAESRRQELNRLQADLNTKTRQVAPLQNLPQKVVLASHQINDFYGKRFPARSSEILTALGKLKDTSGVSINQAKYKEDDEGPGHLRPVEIEMDLSGSYTALAKFINSMERDQTFFIINSVSLGGEGQGPIKLQMKIETYLKAA